MSIKSNQDNIARIEKEVAALEKKLAAENKKEFDKIKQASQIERSINKNTSVNSLRTKQNRLLRIQGDLAKISKSKADISKKIADKNKQKFNYQQNLERDLKSEQLRRDLEGKRRRQEEINHQRKITNEILLQQQISSKIEAPNNFSSQKKFDFFISHAYEDKKDFVEPLANKMTEMGLDIWYDEFQLKVGDSLRKSIDHGLKNSTFGVVILSEAFFKKNWTEYELNGLVTREMQGMKVILPIWHKISKDEVINYSPTLADKYAFNSSILSIEEIAAELKKLVQ